MAGKPRRGMGWRKRGRRCMYGQGGRERRDWMGVADGRLARVGAKQRRCRRQKAQRRRGASTTDSRQRAEEEQREMMTYPWQLCSTGRGRRLLGGGRVSLSRSEVLAAGLDGREGSVSGVHVAKRNCGRSLWGRAGENKPLDRRRCRMSHKCKPGAAARAIRSRGEGSGEGSGEAAA